MCACRIGVRKLVKLACSSAASVELLMTDENSSDLEFEEAVSALLEYGFSKALIKRTLKDVLKVYAGNGAWPLIKENGYEVVIERLLSDDGLQQRKSQRKAQHGPDKEKQKGNLDSDTSKAGGASGSNKRSSSSLLLTPILDTENIDIQLHQGISWTRTGLFPLPAWLTILDVPKKDEQQKFLDLRVLLERIDNDCSKRRQCASKCTLDGKDEKFEIIEEIRQASFSKGEMGQNEAAVDRGALTDERLATKPIENINSGRAQPFEKPLQNSDVGTGFWQQKSNSTSLKTQKVANVVHGDVAGLGLCRSSLAVPQTQKSADVLHPQHDVGPATSEATGPKYLKQKDSLGNGPKRRKGVFQGHITLEPAAASQAIRTKPPSVGERTNNLQTFYATERIDVARLSACKLSRRRDGGPNPMFSRLQKCKRASAGASLQTNQHVECDLHENEGDVPTTDAGENTLCVLVRAEETRDEKTRLQESPKLPPGFWEQPVEKHTAILNGKAAIPDPVSSPGSPNLPPGFWERSCADSGSSPDSPELPPGFWEPCGASQDPIASGQIENEDKIVSDNSPLLPPGFSEPHDDSSSEESPRLPPGFGEPHDSSSEESPRLPPGFGEPTGEIAERLQSRFSPDLPRGFREPSGNHKVFRSPECQITESRKMPAEGTQEEYLCPKNKVNCKDTPSRQVFIANIPEDFEGVGQKLYSLVREVLEGFKSVPISVTLPRKIQVRGDHAFVEFDCEAMAGIFMDAYHANVSVFKIDDEQLLAARNMHLMKRDNQLRHAVSIRLKGQVLDPRNTFYLGNVPSEWQNEKRLISHLASLLQGDASSTLISKALTVYTIPDFSDVYIHFQTHVLAETFFLRCLSDKKHLEEINASLFVLRNFTFLPRASRMRLDSECRL